MVLDILVHEKVWKELPSGIRSEVETAMADLVSVDQPGEHPGSKRLAGSPVHSWRLRVGRWRLLFVFFPSEGVVYFTTAFLKRRSSDYDQALVRHRARLRDLEL